MPDDDTPVVPLPPTAAGAVRPELLPCPAPASPAELPPPVLRRLLTDFTGPGDLVVALDDTAAAQWPGRRHVSLTGDSHLVALGELTGTVRLLLLHWPRRGLNPLHLLRACRALLTEAGCLVVVQYARDDRVASLSALAGAAGNAGLLLMRHLVAIDVPAHGGRQARLLRPHTDALVFVARDDVDEPVILSPWSEGHQ